MVTAGFWWCPILFVCFQMKTFRRVYPGIDCWHKGQRKVHNVSLFPNLLEAERYLSDIDIYCFRVALTQLRLGVLAISNNMYRYSDCLTNWNCILPWPHWKQRSFPFSSSFVHKFKKQISGAKSCSVVTGHVTLERYRKRCRLLSKFTFHAMNRRKLYM